MYSLQKRAHKAVEHAVAKGILHRPDLCDECSNPCKPHAHHDDYGKPLDIRWLCQPCHSVIHPGMRRLIAADVKAGLLN